MNEILVLVSTDIVIEAVNVGLSIVSEAFFIPHTSWSCKDNVSNNYQLFYLPFIH